MKKHLSLKPYDIKSTIWLYEEMTGLKVIHEIKDHNENYIRTDQFTIPLGKIRAYLKRRDKKESK